MENTFPAEIRKKKTIALLIVAGVLSIVILVILIVDTHAFNKNVEETQCSVDKIPSDGCVEYQSTLEYETNVKERKRGYTLPVVLLLIISGIVIGFMFLPGYPFSKYLSYKECMQLANLVPQDGWNWSSSQNSNEKDLLCVLFGACRCRSFTQELNCQLYKEQDTSQQVFYDFEKAQKKTSTSICSNRCACNINGAFNYLEQTGNYGDLSSGTCSGSGVTCTF